MTRSVRLDEMAEAMTGRGTPLQPESALFIALQACEAMRAGPVMPSVEEVAVDEEGHVRLSPKCPRADDEAASNEALMSVLEALLVPLPANVIELATRVRGGEIGTRAAMLSELQAVLVPFNRGAAQRMLGRMVREHHRFKLGRATTERASDEPGERDGEAALLTGAIEPKVDVAGADTTWVDGDAPMRAAADAADTEPDAPTRDDWAPAAARRGPSQTVGVMMLLVSLAALVSGAWFLWTRVRGG